MTPLVADPGHERRGRPRNESCTGEILTAVLSLAAEVGIAGLTMDAVAARAGVGKATIYRRWETKEALLVDAWVSAATIPPTPDTGSLRGDLEELMLHNGPSSGDVDLQRVFPQLVAAARANPQVSEAYQSFIEQRRAPLRAVLRRAVERGEIDRNIDLEVVYDLFIAPLILRSIVTSAPMTDDVVTTVIHVVMAGIAP